MRTKTDTRGEIETPQDLEKWMGEYARASLALRDARLERDRAVTAAREAYEAREPELRLAVEAAFKQLELWGRRHPEAFEPKKSLELVQGRIGFRTGTPRVSLPRGVDEEALCCQLELAGEGEWVRRSPALDKQAILRVAASEDEVDKARLARLAETYGIRVRQEERFFAEAREEKSDE
ncbi:MAG: host-nuclease inhibitor Gam family protein [Kiritimatiellae bacterium]|nr:host-nuclease inhibitor Gam family protein [Kiritimatiellia bacterium]